MRRTKRFELTRRHFLGGAAAAISLPFLEAMTPFHKDVYAQTLGSTKRMIAYYIPNGIHMAAFRPDTVGANYDLKTILQPLGEANVQNMVSVVTGLNNRPANPDGPGDHAAGTGSFLTATHVLKTEGANIQNGISVDQVAANAIEALPAGEKPRFSSLQVGMDGGGSTGNCDSGYSCAYARNISWANATTPLPKEVNPQVLFDRLFGGFNEQETEEERDRRRRYDLSVLDNVVKDIDRLNQRLGMRDRLKLDQYLTALRQLENDIATMDGPTLCGIPAEPNGNYNVTQKAQVMADLMTVALQCDSTRVISFMLSNAGSNRSYDFLGVPDGHHSISHHQNLQTNFDRLTTIGNWEVAQFAYLVQNLMNTDDGTGTPLIDSTSLFFSSEITDGNRHNHDDMPVLLAGNPTFFRNGEHIELNNAPPLGNFFITWLESMGVNVNAFGDDGIAGVSAVKV